MKIVFHWSLFHMIQLPIFQYWFISWLGAGESTRQYLNQWRLNLMTYKCVTRPQWVNPWCQKYTISQHLPILLTSLDVFNPVFRKLVMFSVWRQCGSLWHRGNPLSLKTVSNVNWDYVAKDLNEARLWQAREMENNITGKLKTVSRARSAHSWDKCKYHREYENSNALECRTGLRMPKWHCVWDILSKKY